MRLTLAALTVVTMTACTLNTPFPVVDAEIDAAKAVLEEAQAALPACERNFDFLPSRRNINSLSTRGLVWLSIHTRHNAFADLERRVAPLDRDPTLTQRRACTMVFSMNVMSWLDDRTIWPGEQRPFYSRLEIVDGSGQLLFDPGSSMSEKLRIIESSPEVYPQLVEIPESEWQGWVMTGPGVRMLDQP